MLKENSVAELPVYRSALELQDALAVSGYDMVVLQTTPEPFAASFRIKRAGNLAILALASKGGIRCVGRRNLRATCISTILKGRGGWQTLAAHGFPDIAGFHLNNPVSNFFLNPGSLLAGVLFNRSVIEQEAEARAAAGRPGALLTLHGTNWGTPDLAIHQNFADQCNAIYSDRSSDTGALQDLALDMLESIHTQGTRHDLSNINAEHERVATQLPVLVRQISSGVKLSKTQASEQCQVSDNTFNRVLNDLLGIKFKELEVLCRIEGLVRLLNSPVYRIQQGVGHSVKECREAMNLSEATMKRNMTKLRETSASQLLILP